MTPQTALGFVQHGMEVALLISAPLLLAALVTGPQFAAHTARVRGVLLGLLALILVLLFVLPVPRHTVAEGVVWLPEQAILRALQETEDALVRYDRARSEDEQLAAAATDSAHAASLARLRYEAGAATLLEAAQLALELAVAQVARWHIGAAAQYPAGDGRQRHLDLAGVGSVADDD